MEKELLKDKDTRHVFKDEYGYECSTKTKRTKYKQIKLKKIQKTYKTNGQNYIFM